MYVMISNPTFTRKEVLKLAIDVTTTLKDFEAFKTKIERKIKKIQEVRGLLFDIRKTGKDLKNSLPELPEEKLREVQKKPEIKEKPEVKKEIPKKIGKPALEKPVSKEEDALTRELMEIQRKLKSL